MPTPGGRLRNLLDEGFAFDLPGVSGNYASTPDSAALSVTGDLDIRVRVLLDDWTPSAVNSLVSKYVTGTNNRSYRFYISAAGNLVLTWSTDGSGSVSASSSGPTGFTNGRAKWVRVTLDGNNGSNQYVATFYTSDDGENWTQFGSAVTNTATSIFDGNAPLEVGSFNTGSGQQAAGKFYRVQVLDGIDGTLVFDANFADPSTRAGRVTFVDQSPERATITLNGTKWFYGPA